MPTVELTPEILNGFPTEAIIEIFVDLGVAAGRDIQRDGAGAGPRRLDKEHQEALLAHARGLRCFVLQCGGDMSAFVTAVWTLLRVGYALAHVELEREKSEVEELTK